MEEMGVCNLVSNTSVEDQLESFGRMEKFPMEKKLAQKEEFYEQMLLSTTERRNDGRIFLTLLQNENGLLL